MAQLELGILSLSVRVTFKMAFASLIQRVRKRNSVEKVDKPDMSLDGTADGVDGGGGKTKRFNAMVKKVVKLNTISNIIA